MKVTLIMVLMAVVGLSSAYSLGDVYEKLQRVERDMSSGSTGTSMSLEKVEKRDISGGSGSMSVERIEKRDISGGSGSMSVERIEKRDISGGSSSLESREKRDAFAVSHDLDLRRLRRSASSGSGSYSIED
ncbi:uncharacterized protein LOC125034480 isoform X2 [Penaeus chinensis]|uniref:uncharacterized protein LOC125034476 isoform X3 n=1 Tax=Penaeus chinensis TaxID=139456 RepID=UPI001FB7EF66|nr:uncharacterized protein LOC125034476 isoform X3 [Penaeus chinensis]XP_047482248.1 uncharacterized protein LOC125034480 isoform X2 [Penaeus chinensis]